MGVLLQEKFSPFYNPESGSADPGPAIYHFQEMEALNPFVFIFLLLGACVCAGERGGRQAVNRSMRRVLLDSMLILCCV